MSDVDWITVDAGGTCLRIDVRLPLRTLDGALLVTARSGNAVQNLLKPPSLARSLRRSSPSIANPVVMMLLQFECNRQIVDAGMRFVSTVCAGLLQSRKRRRRR